MNTWHRVRNLFLGACAIILIASCAGGSKSGEKKELNDSSGIAPDSMRRGLNAVPPPGRRGQSAEARRPNPIKVAAGRKEIEGWKAGLDSKNWLQVLDEYHDIL